MMTGISWTPTPAYIRTKKCLEPPRICREINDFVRYARGGLRRWMNTYTPMLGRTGLNLGFSVTRSSAKFGRSLKFSCKIGFNVFLSDIQGRLNNSNVWPRAGGKQSWAPIIKTDWNHDEKSLAKIWLQSQNSQSKMPMIFDWFAHNPNHASWKLPVNFI